MAKDYDQVYYSLERNYYMSKRKSPESNGIGRCLVDLASVRRNEIISVATEWLLLLLLAGRKFDSWRDFLPESSVDILANKKINPGKLVGRTG
jgi:hypothetical protein